MRLGLSLCFFLLIISRCNLNESGLFTISTCINIEESATLSDFADDIKYVPLDGKFPIGIIYSMRLNSNNIYLSIKDIGIVQYSADGHYVRTIGTKGNGPGEYRYGMYFTVDDKNQRIYLIDREKIKVFSASGKFLREFSYKEYISESANGLEILNSSLFIPDFLLGIDPKYNWIITDTLGEIVSLRKSHSKIFYPNMGILGTTYKYNNKLYYFNLFSDTVFTIKEDFECNPTYVFSEDFPRRPVNGFGKDPWSQLKSLFIVTRMFETNDFIFVEYAYGDNGAFLIVNKTSKDTYKAYTEFHRKNSSKYTRAEIINDLDGGMPLSLHPIYYYLSVDGSEYICSILDALDLKKYITSNMFKNSAPKYPDKKLELEKFSEIIKPVDNPVIMLVRLKK